MSTKKKAKGKARKAKGAAKKEPRVWWEEWAKYSHPCLHGCVLPSKGHPVYEFMDDWQKLTQTKEGMQPFPIMEMTLQKHREVWDNEEMKKMARDIIVSIGTNLILSGKQQLVHNAGCNCHCIILLENYRYDDNGLGVATHRGAAEMRDINGGVERDYIKFYLKRVSCSCLKKEYSKAKKTQSKEGCCSYCRQKQAWNTLMVCNQCKIEQYCSRACQKAHWPIHKKTCHITTVINHLS